MRQKFLISGFFLIVLTICAIFISKDTYAVTRQITSTSIEGYSVENPSVTFKKILHPSQKQVPLNLPGNSKVAQNFNVIVTTNFSDNTETRINYVLKYNPDAK